MFTNLNLTDMETCYKVFRREVIQSHATSRRTGSGSSPRSPPRSPRAGWRVYEVGISYNGRTYAEGKKIGWRDGVRALWCIVKYSKPGEQARTVAGVMPAPDGASDATGASGAGAAGSSSTAPAPSTNGVDGHDRSTV